MNRAIVKQISFPKPMIQLMESKSQKLGVNIPEYIRYLVLKDTERTFEDKNYEFIEDVSGTEIEQAIGEAKKELRENKGKMRVLSSHKDIDEYIKEVADEI